MSPALHSTVDILTTPELAARLHVAEWKIRSLIRRKLLTPPRKIGQTWAWAAADVDRARSALEAAGYLPSTREASCPT